METSKAVVFTAPGQVEARSEAFERSPLAHGQALIRNRYTMVSPGTELACLAGKNTWFPLPKSPGYAAVGEVTAVAEGSPVKVGDLVSHGGPHRAWHRLSPDEIFMTVPAGVEPRDASGTQLVNIAMASTTASNIQVGDHVAVVGQGMVGNLAAQLARLSGAIVHVIDVSEARLDVSRACGLARTLNPKARPVREAILEATGGQGVTTLIDATGSSRVIVDNLPLVADRGELILLGTPRDAFTCDVTPVFEACHRRGVTLRGAHIGHAPLKATPHQKHSRERKARIILEAMKDGGLRMKPLITHEAKPEDAPEIYRQLAAGNDRMMGVVFSWN